MKEEITSAVVKATPPAAVTGAHFILGLSLSDWVSVATLVYIALQVFLLIWSQVREKR